MFVPGAAVPYSQVAFAVLDPMAALSLHTVDGVSIPASIRTIGDDKVFAPDGQLEPGMQLVLTYGGPCPAPFGTGRFAFSTTREISEGYQYTHAVKLNPAERGIEVSRRGEVTAYALAYVSVDAPSHLIDYKIWVDDQPIAFAPSYYGSLPVLRLESPCDRQTWGPTSCGNWVSFPPGNHRVNIEAHVIGSTTQPAPAVFSLATTCDWDELDPRFAADAAVPAPDAALPSVRAKQGDGGCRLGSGDSSGAGLAALLLALALMRRRQEFLPSTARPGGVRLGVARKDRQTRIPSNT